MNFHRRLRFSTLVHRTDSDELSSQFRFEIPKSAPKMIDHLPCWLCLALLGHMAEVSHQHGLMIEPPARNAMWRFGFPTPPDYGENELFCGGLQV